jgi:uncharacterized protein YkwD
MTGCAHRTGITAAVIVLAAGIVIATSGTASASCTDSSALGGAELRAAERDIASMVNAERAAHGVRPLEIHAGIAQVATGHSGQMAGAGRIWHNDAYFTMHDELGASRLAENVGMACSTDQMHRAFMDSAPHRANVMDGRLTHLGLGAASDGTGRLFMTQGFAAVAPVPVAPAPKPAARVAPAAKPAAPARVATAAVPAAPRVPAPTVPPEAPQAPADGGVGIEDGRFSRIEQITDEASADTASASPAGVRTAAAAALVVALGFAVYPRRRRTSAPPPPAATIRQLPGLRPTLAGEPAAVRG